MLILRTAVPESQNGFEHYDIPDRDDWQDVLGSAKGHTAVGTGEERTRGGLEWRCRRRQPSAVDTKHERTPTPSGVASVCRPPSCSPTDALVVLELGHAWDHGVVVRQRPGFIILIRQPAGAGFTGSPMWVRIRSIGALGERPLSVAFLPEGSKG